MSQTGRYWSAKIDDISWWPPGWRPLNWLWELQIVWQNKLVFFCNWIFFGRENFVFGSRFKKNPGWVLVRIKTLVSTRASYYFSNDLITTDPGHDRAIQSWGQILSPWLTGYTVVVAPAHQARYAGGPVRQPYAIVDYIPQSGTKNLVGDKCLVWNLWNRLWSSLWSSLYNCQ